MSHDNRLRAFIAVADASSITGAALGLAISQPSLSRQLKLLEQQMGVKLLHRHGRGVSLTNAGVDLYQVLNPAFHRIDAAIGLQSLKTQSVTGHLRIAIVHTLNSYFTAPVIHQLLAQYPNLRLQTFERSSLEVSQLVERGQADLGLAYDTMVSGEGLRISQLHLERMQLYASPKLRLQRDDLGRVEITPSLPMVVMPAGYAIRQMIDRQFGARLKIVIQVETTDLMLELVRSGEVACILPCHLPNRRIEDTGLVRYEIGSSALERRVVALTKSRSGAQLPAIELLVKQFEGFSQSLVL